MRLERGNRGGGTEKRLRGGEETGPRWESRVWARDLGDAPAFGIPGPYLLFYLPKVVLFRPRTHPPRSRSWPGPWKAATMTEENKFCWLVKPL